MSWRHPSTYDTASNSHHKGRRNKTTCIAQVNERTRQKKTNQSTPLNLIIQQLTCKRENMVL